MTQIDTAVAEPVVDKSPMSTPTIRTVLAFEKPLAKLEQQIVELQAMEADKQLDYAVELRQLRGKLHFAAP